MKDQGDWLRQMTQLQQQYWDGWRDMAGQAMAPQPGAAATASWQDGLAAWQRGFAGSSPAGGFAAGSQNDLVERMLGYGKQYLGLLQGLMSGGGFQPGSMKFDPQAWIGELRELQQRYGQGLAGVMGPVEALPWFGGIDSAQIEQLVKGFASSPLRGMQQDLEGWLAMPAFGPAREHQERKQALMRAWLDYQVANQRYHELMLRSLTRTLDLLDSKLAERDEPGRRIESARALYDLWIDAAEDAYAEIALSAEYREIYGNLINAQMRVRAGLNAEVERFAAQLGMPTRTEVDSLARQLHDLKRELRRGGTADRQAPPNRDRSRDIDVAATVDAGKMDAQAKATPKPEAGKAKGKEKAQRKSKSGNGKRSAAKRAAAVPTVKARVDAGGKSQPSKRSAADTPTLQSTARKRGKGA